MLWTSGSTHSALLPIFPAKFTRAQGTLQRTHSLTVLLEYINGRWIWMEEKILSSEMFSTCRSAVASVWISLPFHSLAYSPSMFIVQGEPGKPPPGYKCRRCESTEASLSFDTLGTETHGYTSYSTSLMTALSGPNHQKITFVKYAMR